METYEETYETYWEELQSEMKRWLKNYSNAEEENVSQPVLSIISEIGKFQDCNAPDMVDDVDALRDSVGSVMVFVANYCYLRSDVPELDLLRIMDEAKHYFGRLQINIISAMGRLARGLSEFPQDNRSNVIVSRALVEIVCWCMANVEAINANVKKNGTCDPMDLDKVVKNYSLPWMR